MKSKRNNSIKLAVIIILLSALYNICLAQNFKPIKGNTLVKLNGFSVKSPSGDDWEYLVSANKKTVWFRDESSNFLTGDEMKTYVRVFEDSDTIPGNKSEEEFAGEYLNTQCKIIIDQMMFDVEKEDIDIDNERKFDTVIALKKFYAKEYSISYSFSVLNKGYTDNLLFVYIPENFRVSHSLFVFDISSSYNQPFIFETNSSDLAPIYKIIKTFNLEETAKQ